MEQKLEDLVNRLKKAERERLVSVILYGSAAAGNHHAEFSDLNVLCVLTRVTPAELADAEPIFKWWRAQGNPSPLLLSEEEVRTSTDCFPIEFHDMQERRQVLFGKDVIEGLLDRQDLLPRTDRAWSCAQNCCACGRKRPASSHDKQALLRLMIDSVSNFLVLSRHALLVSGTPTGYQKREIARNLPAIGADPSPFDTLLDLRERNQEARRCRSGSAICELSETDRSAWSRMWTASTSKT